MIYYDDELYHYDDELYHHGVKGMKWGVRRFQKRVSNGISRIRRKGQRFYKQHKTGIRRAAIGAATAAGAAALGYGAYRLDKRYNGGRGAKAIAGAYGKARKSASGMYTKANSRIGDYYKGRANKLMSKSNAHRMNVQTLMGKRNGNAANDAWINKNIRAAKETASQYDKWSKRNRRRAAKYYARSFGGLSRG